MYPQENPHLEFIILSIFVIITDSTIRKDTLRQATPNIILNGVIILSIYDISLHESVALSSFSYNFVSILLLLIFRTRSSRLILLRVCLSR